MLWNQWKLFVSKSDITYMFRCLSMEILIRNNGMCLSVKFLWSMLHWAWEIFLSLCLTWPASVTGPNSIQILSQLQIVLNKYKYCSNTPKNTIPYTHCVLCPNSRLAHIALMHYLIYCGYCSSTLWLQLQYTMDVAQIHHNHCLYICVLQILPLYTMRILSQILYKTEIF